MKNLASGKNNFSDHIHEFEFKKISSGLLRRGPRPLDPLRVRAWSSSQYFRSRTPVHDFYSHHVRSVTPE